MTGTAFHGLADLLPEPMVLLSRGGRVLAVNRASRVALPDLAPGQALSEVFVVEPDRAATFLRDCARVRRPLPGAFADRAGRSWRVKGARYGGANGEPPAVMLRLERDAEASAGFLALNMQVAALRSEMRTRRRAEVALKQERERLRVTLSSIGDAVIATDPLGRVTFMNPVAQALTGWAQEDAAGRLVSEVFQIINETSRAPVDDPVAKVLRDGRVVGLANHTLLIARDGTEWPIDDSAAPIRGEDDALEGVVLVFHEISERRRLDQLQRDRIGELEREAQLKDEFLAMLAHELRNPLAPLLTLSALLARSPGPEMISRVRAVLERQVRQLSRLVDDLLDVSRITRGKIDLRREVVDVVPLIKAALETVRPLADAQGHAVRLTLRERLPQVEGDPLRLEQVVCNLLTNAVKYTPPGGEIEVGAHEDGEELVVVVRDSGVGIDPQLLPQVFEPFVQGDRSLDRSQGGLGIGLTLVKHLLELHGGTCSIHSDGAGRGCEAAIRLPALRSTALPTPRTDAAGRRLRILVVDDQRDAADLLAELLRAWGHHVLTAYDGQSALETALVTRPDVTLLDIGLPIMDGYEVARRIRRAPGLSQCVMVAVTGYGQDADRERSQEVGLAAHLLKPIDPEVLRELLTTLTRR